MNKVLGIDIGGTKIRFAIIDSEGDFVHDVKIPTEFPLYPYMEKYIQSILQQFPEVDAIGIGTHGFVDSQRGRIVFSTDAMPGWSGTELKMQLEQATGKRVEVENDANCAAFAEAKFGAAKGYGRVVCLTLGTGLGGGIVWDGKLLSGGRHGGAAEIGHMTLYPGGALCACGRKGCSEQYVSGTGLRRIINEAGLEIKPEELFELAQHDGRAQKLVDDFTRDLAAVISSLQAIFDMDVIVIGGGVCESADYWMPCLNNHLNALLLNPLEVKIADFRNEAGVLGASLLVRNNNA